MTETPEMKALRTIRGMHNAAGERWVGFPRADRLEAYCTNCGQSAPCSTARVITEALEAQEPKPHDRWTDIDWVQEDHAQPPRMMSHSVEPCTCETPWRHYP